MYKILVVIFTILVGGVRGVTDLYWEEDEGEMLDVGVQRCRAQDYPFMVFFTDKKCIPTLCSGALIATDWVLTSKYCVNERIDINNCLAIAGTAYLSSDMWDEYTVKFICLMATIHSEGNLGLVKIDTSNQFPHHLYIIFYSRDVQWHEDTHWNQSEDINGTVNEKSSVESSAENLLTSEVDEVTRSEVDEVKSDVDEVTRSEVDEVKSDVDEVTRNGVDKVKRSDVAEVTRSDEDEEQLAYVLGFQSRHISRRGNESHAHLKPKKPYAAALKRLVIPLLSEEQCARNTSEVLFEHVLCTSCSFGGRQSCMLDTGGPLVYQGQLVGIVSGSQSKHCYLKQSIALYTKVPAYANWIDTVLQVRTRTEAIMSNYEKTGLFMRQYESSMIDKAGGLSASGLLMTLLLMGHLLWRSAGMS